MNYSDNRIQEALKAKISTNELDAEEQEVFFEKLFIQMQQKITPEQEASFKAYISQN